MMRDKLELLFSEYKRHGSKRNRAAQMQRVRAVMQHVGVYHPEQLGNDHIYDFYRYLALNETAERTIYYYWLALCVLWQLLKRPKKPPKPLWY
jgi:hypothetical protein